MTFEGGSSTLLKTRNDAIRRLTGELAAQQRCLRVSIPAAGGWQEVVFASAYFPGDVKQIPQRKSRALFNTIVTEKRIWFLVVTQMPITRSGAARTIINGWLLDFILITNLEILNRGKEPTFENKIRGKSLI